MRMFVSRRLGRNWRAGVSLDPRELSGPRRRGRPPARVPVSVRPHHFYYGLDLDADPLIEPQPHVYHPWRDLWTIIKISVWLLGQFVLWLGIVVGLTLGAIVLIMGALTRL